MDLEGCVVDARIIGELIIEEADVNGKTYCQNVNESVINDVEVGVEP